MSTEDRPSPRDLSDLARRHYGDPEVREQILAQVEDRFVSFRMLDRSGDTWFKRNWNSFENRVLVETRIPCSSGCGSLFLLRETPEPPDWWDAPHPATWEYWQRHPVMEIHASTELRSRTGRTDFFVVDLDPEGFTPGDERLQKAVGSLRGMLDRELPCKALSLRETGGRGIHLTVDLPHCFEIFSLQREVQALLRRHLPEGCSLTPIPKGETGIYVDLSCLRPQGTFRLLGSMHHKTGGVCREMVRGGGG